VLVLFARHLDMPAAWVGILISFAPLSQLLVIATVPLVERFGPKRILMISWILRNVAAAPVLAIPWLAGPGNERIGWYILGGGTLGFCIMRAIGSSGWFPWLHEIVPEDQRGAYFSTEQGIVQVTIVILAVTAALILGRSPTLSGFLCIYTIGLAAGLVSVLRMWRIPGGRKFVANRSVWEGFRAYRHVLADRGFMAYVALASMGIGCIMWVGASHIMYMRDMLHMSSRTIMILTSMGAFAIVVTIRSWSRFAERKGSAQALALAVLAHSLVAFAWLALTPDGHWTRVLVAPVLVTGYVFGGASGALVSHGLLVRIPDVQNRISYTNVHTFFTALVFGITPIIAGYVITWWGLTGFRLCFLVSGVAGTICAVAGSFVPAENKVSVSEIDRILRPSMPLRTMARILWITIGLDSDSKKTIQTQARSKNQEQETSS
jgi:MFS family permease